MRFDQPFLFEKIGCAALAMAASTVSLLLAAMAGWNNGGSSTEQALLAASGVLPVVGAHLLPALVRGASRWTRCLVWLVWVFCMVLAMYGHATYFLLAQHRAGMQRANHVATTGEHYALVRPLSAILLDEARVRGQLAKIGSLTCQDCPSVRRRTAELTAKITALGAEAEESRRDQDRRDRADQLRDQLRADPVGSKLALWLGSTHELAALLPAFAFAAILDGLASLASLCWLLVTERRYSQVAKQAPITVSTVPAVTLPVTAPVTSVTPPVTPFSPDTPDTPVTPVTPAIPVTQVMPVRVTPPLTAQGTARVPLLVAPAVTSEVAPVTRSTTTTTSPEAGTSPTGAVPARVTALAKFPDIEQLVARVKEDYLSESNKKPTVREIRKFLRCSQGKALDVQRALQTSHY